MAWLLANNPPFQRAIFPSLRTFNLPPCLLFSRLRLPSLYAPYGCRDAVADVTAAPRDTKSHWGGWGFRSNSKAAPSHDTVADFERKARSSCALKPEYGDAMHYKLISKEELDKAFHEGGWSDFYKKYPDAGGVWTFSRPGYNSARNEAVLSVSHACGELCGTGHLYFLTKRDGQWKVQNRLMLWIS